VFYVPVLLLFDPGKSTPAFGNQQYLQAPFSLCACLPSLIENGVGCWKFLHPRLPNSAIQFHPLRHIDWFMLAVARDAVTNGKTIKMAKVDTVIDGALINLVTDAATDGVMMTGAAKIYVVGMVSGGCVLVPSSRVIVVACRYFSVLYSLPWCLYLTFLPMPIVSSSFLLYTGRNCAYLLQCQKTRSVFLLHWLHHKK
jgi:hypothetical protein